MSHEKGLGWMMFEASFLAGGSKVDIELRGGINRSPYCGFRANVKTSSHFALCFASIAYKYIFPRQYHSSLVNKISIIFLF
jgi:hypothetical protein